MVVDRLVVRARAGLPAAVRRRFLLEQGTQEVGAIPPLGASVITVPRERCGKVARALRRSGYFKSVGLDFHVVAAQATTDADLAEQWGLSRIGAPQAWTVSRGSSAVIVAVVDTGIDLSHPDLRDQVLSGYDFANGDADASDDSGHGTRMAGIIAAEAFNDVGGAGVAPGCTLLPVKVLGADGSGTYSTVAQGIIYAVDRGARVINLSLVGTAPADILQSAVDYAAARGALVVAAAGNGGAGAPAYPAAYPNAVAVAATDQSDAVASFSNFGAWISLAAPGVDIFTTNWSAAGGADYTTSTGTSPAAAFVSGVLGLVLSAHPELSNNDAVSMLTRSAHDVGTSGWDPYSGWGRVDVAAALGVNSRSPSPTPVPTPGHSRRGLAVSIITPTRNSVVSGDAPVDVAAEGPAGIIKVDLLADGVVVSSDAAPPFAFVLNTNRLAPGRHLLRARAYAANGRSRVSKTVRVTVTRA